MAAKHKLVHKALTVPLVEEALSVRRKTIETGHIRITKDVEARTELVDEKLREEQLKVERRPLNPPVEVADYPTIRQEGSTTVISLVEERLVVEKRLFVTEEIYLTRVQRQRREKQQVVLRRERAVVERSPAAKDVRRMTDRAPSSEGGDS